MRVIVKTKIFDEFHGNGFTADEFGPDVGKNEIKIEDFRGVDRDREVARLALKQRYFDKEHDTEDMLYSIRLVFKFMLSITSTDWLIFSKPQIRCILGPKISGLNNV